MSEVAAVSPAPAAAVEVGTTAANVANPPVSPQATPSTPFHLASHLESQFDPAAVQGTSPSEPVGSPIAQGVLANSQSVSSSAQAVSNNAQPATDVTPRDSADLKRTVESETNTSAPPEMPSAAPEGIEALPAPAPSGPENPLGAAQSEVSGLAADESGPFEILTFDQVILSTTESFPAIREAAMLRTIAIGNQISALGEFDDKLEGATISQPLGFYENYRHDIGWKKPLIMGGTSYFGYRLGDGDFEPWYGERETDEGGELKAGFDIPLLQNRLIDPRRTAVRLASLDIQRASPELFQQVLTSQFEAANAYWSWLAAAKQFEINAELMRLAEVRVDQIQKQIEAGDVAQIVGIDNRRLLASRRAKLIESRQKLDASAIKLSLYYRDNMGRPSLPAKNSRPADFPPLPPASLDVDAEIRRAIVNRPELDILGIIEQQTRAELRLAINQRLPEVSFGTEVSQDVGGLTSSKGDKQPFKLEAGLVGSVPVQRRKAIGKAQALRGKLAQIDAKRQLTTEKIANDVRQAATVYEAAILRLEQARLTKELALQTLRAGEIAFRAGDIDILLLNIYEQAYADAGVDVINAQAELFTAEALLSTATGTSLLDDIELLPLAPADAF